jgi:hypothetical protein
MTPQQRADVTDAYNADVAAGITPGDVGGELNALLQDVTGGTPEDVRDLVLADRSGQLAGPESVYAADQRLTKAAADSGEPVVGDTAVTRNTTYWPDGRQTSLRQSGQIITDEPHPEFPGSNAWRSRPATLEEELAHTQLHGLSTADHEAAVALGRENVEQFRRNADTARLDEATAPIENYANAGAPDLVQRDAGSAAPASPSPVPNGGPKLNLGEELARNGQIRRMARKMANASIDPEDRRRRLADLDGPDAASPTPTAPDPGAADKLRLLGRSGKATDDHRTRLDAIMTESDPATAHRDLAKLMTEMSLGGKQRKRYRELLVAHMGLGTNIDSAKVEAAATADGLSPDNPLKSRLAAKAAEAPQLATQAEKVRQNEAGSAPTAPDAPEAPATISRADAAARMFGTDSPQARRAAEMPVVEAPNPMQSAAAISTRFSSDPATRNAIRVYIEEQRSRSTNVNRRDNALAEMRRSGVDVGRVDEAAGLRGKATPDPGSRQTNAGKALMATRDGSWSPGETKQWLAQASMATNRDVEDYVHIMRELNHRGPGDPIDPALEEVYADLVRNLDSGDPAGNGSFGIRSDLADLQNQPPTPEMRKLIQALQQILAGGGPGKA